MVWVCGYRPKLTLSMRSSSLYDIDESIFMNDASWIKRYSSKSWCSLRFWRDLSGKWKQKQSSLRNQPDIPGIHTCLAYFWGHLGELRNPRWHSDFTEHWQACSQFSLSTMHFFKALTLSLLPLAALGAKKPAADKFEQFHSKALSSPPLKLDDATYGKLTSTPRDYSVAVLLTALEVRFG